eukprot:COSAG01_NODE_3217_length_6400_cov_4.602444_3_plen_262_part_00
MYGSRMIAYSVGEFVRGHRGEATHSSSAGFKSLPVCCCCCRARPQQPASRPTDRQLTGLPIGSVLAYTDGGADGNGANGNYGACGFGACITRKQADWTPTCEPTVEDCYFGPVVCDDTDPFWLGSKRATNNTGELNGIATALLHLKTESGHEPAAICYDSKYAANITNSNWDAKSNVEAARINRDLYEAEHERRSGGVIMVHVKGHSGDIGNDYADRFVQDGKGKGPFSRLRLSRSETSAEKRDRHSVLSALALPFELPAA